MFVAAGQCSASKRLGTAQPTLQRLINSILSISRFQKNGLSLRYQSAIIEISRRLTIQKSDNEKACETTANHSRRSRFRNQDRYRFRRKECSHSAGVYTCGLENRCRDDSLRLQDQDLSLMSNERKATTFFFCARPKLILVGLDSFHHGQECSYATVSLLGIDITQPDMDTGHFSPGICSYERILSGSNHCSADATSCICAPSRLHQNYWKDGTGALFCSD